MAVFLCILQNPYLSMHYELYNAARDEPDVESTQADTYEFLGESCYLNQDCADQPLVIENANYEAMPMRYL